MLIFDNRMIIFQSSSRIHPIQKHCIHPTKIMYRHEAHHRVHRLSRRQRQPRPGPQSFPGLQAQPLVGGLRLDEIVVVVADYPIHGEEGAHRAEES